MKHIWQRAAAAIVAASFVLTAGACAPSVDSGGATGVAVAISAKAPDPKQALMGSLRDYD